MDLWSLRNHDPRPEQVKIINEIRSALESDYTNIILEAGTGIGKSPIATTVARYADNSYILTMTNQLQNQYLTDFSWLVDTMKGRRNYSCNYGGTCQVCQMEKENEYKCSDCEYLTALRHAQNSNILLTNYDYLFYAGNYAKQFDKRDLIIFDEAHNFEKKIMSLVTTNVNRHTVWDRYGFDIFEHIAKRGALKDINNPEYWISILTKCEDKEKDIFCTDEYEEKQQTANLTKYHRMIEELENEEFVIELPLRKEILEDKDKTARLKMELKPLSSKEHSDKLLQFGNHRLFMTGTLGNKQLFCKWNGLDPEDTYYIYQKSPFPVENRPIIRKYVCSMKQDGWRNHHIIKYIQKIIDSHNGEKGVIHTSSNQQAWFIKKQLNSRSVWVAQGNTREDTIKRFEESDYPLTLVGAGLKDGVDFKGDKCRYQILFKVPYPSIGSQQVKIRKKLDIVWYIYQTVQPLQQAYGRGIRDMDDYCKFYILDEDFEFLIKEYKFLFNEYFLEGIQ